MLGRPRNLGDGEDRLPDRRVEERTIARLNRGTPRRAVAVEAGEVDLRGERTPAATADEQPVLHAVYNRSMTAAIAWPNPMHIVAMP